MRFEDHGLQAGIWTGRLYADQPATVWLTHLNRDIAQAELAADGDGAWAVRVAVPQTLLCDGVQTLLLVQDGDPRQVLASLSLVCGQVLDSDIRAELELVRAELDLLKREMRRLASR